MKTSRNELLRRLLSGLTDSELETLVQIREPKRRPVPTPRKRIPTPAPRKMGVKQLIRYFENNPIPLYQPIAPPRIKKQPVPLPRTKIAETHKALKGFTKSYEIGIKDNKDNLVQLQNTRLAMSRLFDKILNDTKGFKFVETLKVTFIKMKDGELVDKSGYFNSKVQIVMNSNDISSSLELVQQQIMNQISVWLSEGSGWTISSIDEHYLNTVVYEPMKGNSYIPLPVKLQNSAKGLINIQNKDNECFRWCHIRYLNPQNKDPQRVKIIDKEMVPQLNYQGVEFPVNVKHYSKIEEQNSININVFGYEEEQFYPIYVSKKMKDKVLNLLLITKGEKQHYVLIKDFNKMMYNKTKHKERKHICMFCLQCFSADKILEKHKSNCMVINGQQAIKMPEPGSKIEFTNHHKQMLAPFVIYADFEAITEKISGCEPNNVKSYTNQYQKHTSCSYGYKLVCCYDDKYSKPVKIYRGENTISYFMLDMLSEVEYCKKMINMEFQKPLEMTEEEEDLFQGSDKCYICGHKYLDNEIKVRDHCHITGKYRGSALLKRINNSLRKYKGN